MFFCSHVADSSEKRQSVLPDRQLNPFVMPSPISADDHDLREVPPAMHHDGAALADFDPTPNEPDLDIWPLATDKGAKTFSGDPDDLVPIYNSYPEPHVRWLTPKQFKYEFGYHSNNPAEIVADDALEDINDRRRLTLSKTRMEAFRRVAQLWNGEYVGPRDVHLLADKAPSWNDVVGDLDQRQLDALRPTVHRHDDELVNAFGKFGWFEPENTVSGWFKPTYIARSRADYDIEERARTLINGRDDLPNLRGDPHEGLTHRFGVGVEAARAAFCENRSVKTYKQVDDYTVDLLEYEATGDRVVGEVLTHHHNNRLYRSTFRKLADLQASAVLVFDTRSTARRVLNHWHDRCGDVPGAPFESELNVDWTRSKFAEAAADPARDWSVQELLTISQLWKLVFGEGRAPPARKLMSLNW
ncbi:hypothetical protein [Halobacterium sp. R2-5]|uniref:hypothetical protein n=1 Tax=Halobacterium sp. R2-5 TaxID=2715751 RepID=UPI00141F9C24|nr:hypothetical protein [Halobacterium sp. R2-5]NIC01032.1 hypothetical protein [Halobacterium sp. R2-5]